MTPNIAAELPSARDDAHHIASIDDRLAHGSIIGALLEALNAPEIYQLIHRGGEFFLEPALEI